MQVSSEDITVCWGQKPHPLDSQFGKWRLAVFQDLQESIDVSKLYFLYDPKADEQSGTSGSRKGGPGIIVFDLRLRCFVAEIPIHVAGKLKFLFALKCPSPQGGTSFVLISEDQFYNQIRLNVFRIDLSSDGLSISDVRPLIPQPFVIGGEYICSMRSELPEIVIMANPGLQIWRLNCMAEQPQLAISQFSVPGADLDHFYDAFLSNDSIIFLSATPDGHFDNTRVHLLNLNNPNYQFFQKKLCLSTRSTRGRGLTFQITSQNCSGDPMRGMPIPRKQCGFDAISNAILMAGGEVQKPNGDFERLLDYWTLSTHTFQWIQIAAQMPCGLIEPRLTASNSGNIYIWGDFDEPLPGMPEIGTHLRILRVSGFEEVGKPPEYSRNAVPAPPPYPEVSGMDRGVTPPYPTYTPNEEPIFVEEEEPRNMKKKTSCSIQ